MEEGFVVFEADAVCDPGTMVIVTKNADVADGAVMDTGRFLKLAG